MDTKKWKSILVPRYLYDEIVAISHIEGRTISGQLRLVFSSWKDGNLSKRDMEVLKAQISANHEAERFAEEEALANLVKKELKEAYASLEAHKIN